MLDPIMLAQVNQQHLADLRRECEANRLAQQAREAVQPRPTLSDVRWPRLNWPLAFGLRRRHVAL